MTSNAEYLQVSCSEGPGLRMKVRKMVYLDQSDYQRIAIYDTEGYGRCLFLDGVIQCSEADHELYDAAILGKLRPTDKSLLVLGGGDGHTAQMAVRINPEIRVTIVELDKAVVKASEVYFGQDIFAHPNVTTIIDDAVHFMKHTPSEGYDCIACDLTDMPIGHNGVTCKDFFPEVFSLANRVLNRSGWLVAYTGCNTEIADGITTRTHSYHFEKRAVYVPSFGEPCFIVYGQNIEQISHKEENYERGVIGVRRSANLYRQEI